MKYIDTSIIYQFYQVFIILGIKVVLISCSLSKVASKAVENNGLMALMSPHYIRVRIFPDQVVRSVVI